MTRDLNEIIINALESVKGLDIVTLDVTGLTDVMDNIVVVSGNSNRQVKALANAVIEDCKKAGFRPLGIEGVDLGEWVLVDMGDTVVHVMLPTTRVFYDLEKLWSMRPGDLAPMDNE
ncbi:MAG: ribosome silencing factor [Gammaproteobacteria bacterium]|nr:MAG: ribosome silencing factor [Gammaproteobacteria bacterium]RLA52922.1 MAG: ribosome silencing factor [Gammaproteobacteria bacterium]